MARRTANRRYTYGYGRAEDVAGVLIVVSIAFSAGYILYESIEKFINPQPLTNLPWVAAAALIGGFTGATFAEKRLSARVLQRIFAVIVLIAAIKAAYDAISM